MKAKLEKKTLENSQVVKSMYNHVTLFADEGTKSNGTSACQAAMVPKCKNTGCRSI